MARRFAPAAVVSLSIVVSSGVGLHDAAVASADDRAAADGHGIPTILVSRQLREAHGLSVGEIVRLAANAAGTDARPFRIAAEYEPTPDPLRLGQVRHEVRMHLPDLVALQKASAETVDAINIAVRSPEEASARAGELSARLPGVVVRSTNGDDSRAAPFIVLDRFHLAIAIVTVVASSIFLLALMLMLVDERRRTTAILRLIGFRRRRILAYVLVEGAVLAAAGALAGIALAAALQGGINRFFQWRYDTALVFVRVTPEIALRSIAMAVPLGVFAAMAASWTLLRREVFSLTRR